VEERVPLPDAKPTSSDNSFDVLVVGGGPAGSTIAALLARRGERVLLVEKEHHPRFHIGESLLPANMKLLDELGVGDEIARIGIPKYGVEFVSPYHDGGPSHLNFAQSWDQQYDSAYEVRRSEFDQVLFRNAAAAGALTMEGCRVTGVEFSERGRVVALARGDDGQDHQFTAKFLVDASGRDTLLANKVARKISNRSHHSAAVYGHFTGAHRLPGKAEGNISLFWFDHGWFWFIPLRDGTTSVGAVCHADFIKARNTDVTTFYKSVIAMSPALSDRLRDAELTGPATATGNYSYKSDRIWGPGYLMVGDAYGFIDPVFSSGVYLAMQGAFFAADAVSACLHKPQAEAERVLRRYEAAVNRAMVRFSWFIYRINQPGIRSLFMRHGNPLRMREAVLSLLSGDVFRPSPIHGRLRLFKCVYYLKALAARFARPEAGSVARAGKS
jgi:flavin-dependent dehydrogenase